MVESIMGFLVGILILSAVVIGFSGLIELETSEYDMTNECASQGKHLEYYGNSEYCCNIDSDLQIYDCELIGEPMRNYNSNETIKIPSSGDIIVLAIGGLVAGMMFASCMRRGGN